MGADGAYPEEALSAQPGRLRRDHWRTCRHCNKGSTWLICIGRALDRLSDTIDGRHYCIATGMSGHLEDMLVPPWPAVGLA
jgi:hypothetical protein